MADFQIFSDGACDLGLEKANELGVKMIPFYVSIDHETYYKELEELSLDDYFRNMTQEKAIRKLPCLLCRIILMHSALPLRMAWEFSALRSQAR